MHDDKEMCNCFGKGIIPKVYYIQGNFGKKISCSF
jgi:hypothetical protein